MNENNQIPMRVFVSDLLLSASKDPQALIAAQHTTKLSQKRFSALLEEMMRVTTAAGSGEKYQALRTFLNAFSKLNMR